MTGVDRVTRLISARCPELTPAEIAALTGRDDVALAREIAERMADVLDALNERLAATESRLETVGEAA
jgi:hypothetical protein